MITLSIKKGFQNPFNHHELDDLRVSIKAIIYARVSTDDQAKHGYSLESQVERCHEKLMKEHHIKDDAILSLLEMGEMGDDPNRPALKFAEWLINEGVGEKFAVLHPDRLARNFRQQQEFIEDTLLNKGLNLVSVEVPYDQNSPESVLFFQMQGAIAQYNKAKILANSKRGKKTKLKNGQIPGVRRVYGYSFDTERDTLVENLEEREIYLQMVRWILEGKDGHPMNFTSIARELALLGIKAPSGDKWYQGTVSRILKNPVYTGRFYYGKTEYKQNKGNVSIMKKPESEWYKVKVPAFIDDPTFQKLQNKIKSLSHANRGAVPKTTYLLKGLVRCGRCGSAVVAGSPSRSKKTREIMHHYYTCSGKTRRVYEVGTGRLVHQCKGKNWRQDVIDEHVWRYIVQILMEPDEILQKVITERKDQSEIQELMNKQGTLDLALREKKTERKRWLNLNVKGRISDDELDEELIPLDRDIKQLEESLALANSVIDSLQADKRRVDEIQSAISAFKRYVKEDMTDEEKRRFVVQLVKKVVLYDDEIEIYTVWDTGSTSYADGSHNSYAGQEHGGLPQPVHRDSRGI